MLLLSLVLGVACAAGLLSGLMRVLKPKVMIVFLALTVVPTIRATAPNAADQSMNRFLTRQDDQHSYSAIRRLEARNGSREGWLEATTEYSPAGGFRYQITAEGGSSQIRTRVLKAVLDGEQNVIALGEAARAALAPSNYAFQPNGVDARGSPTSCSRRNEKNGHCSPASCSFDPTRVSSCGCRADWRRTRRSGYGTSTSSASTPLGSTML